MKSYSIIVLLILLGCASKETFQTQFPISISDYFYQIKGNQTHFVIEFQQSISEDIKLEKLYFRNQTAAIKMISGKKAEAIFIKPDLILDANPENEYGNLPPIPQKQRFQLNSNEAVLEFTQNGKIKHYKFTNITEKSNK
ncbi:MAG TPA: hypothetical protein PLL09_08250 [Flavobacterium sp.]|uniref:hypothetical protein n=1 Tax=unclassified Flavobacterium TaxID=196869 RepID=UPI000E83DEE8|nr:MULTISPECIES: hypothetical protein [unclassified Flavobacterium]HBI00240.1 hypothetical protein [Flavobacterium sp.]HRE77801.1 hypothetical protein [Flavobacterium sp.]